MDPQGQLPAYEWDFSDVNPPVHAFAAIADLYNRKKAKYGNTDINFSKNNFSKTHHQFYMVDKSGKMH